MFTDEDKTLIVELGLQSLSKEQQTQQLQSFYRTLNLKVGVALENKLNDKQLAEFEKISNAGNDEATNTWLHQAVPDYEQVVEQELRVLKHNIKQSAAEFRSVMSSEEHDS